MLLVRELLELFITLLKCLLVLLHVSHLLNQLIIIHHRQQTYSKIYYDSWFELFLLDILTLYNKIVLHILFG